MAAASLAPSFFLTTLYVTAPHCELADHPTSMVAPGCHAAGMAESITARGITGTVVFDGAVVHILRTGASTGLSLHISKGTKQIPIGHITAVQFHPARPLQKGFIQFTLPGAAEQHGSALDISRAERDENSVVFNHRQMPAFELLRGHVQGALSARSGGQSSAVPDVQSRMQQLKEMLDSGLITTGEYDLKRIELLSEL